MPNPMDAILSRIQAGKDQRRMNALNDIFAQSYEPSRTETPMFGPTQTGEALPPVVTTGPGRFNEQNALALMAQSKDPGMAMQAFQLQQQMDARELEKQKIKSNHGGPMSIQETLWFLQQPKEVQNQHLALKRAQQVMNLGGTQATLDPTTGQIAQSFQVTPKPEQMPAFQGAQARSKKEGTMAGEQSADLSEMEANLPRLEIVAGQLSKLGKNSTYTVSGKMYDIARKETGLQPRDAAIARKEYISKVDNEVLPLLRQTFGAQFTQKEGESLKATLGDPDATPEEKDAVLKSFIDSKRAQVETQRRRKLGMSAKEYAGVTDISTGPSQDTNPTQKPTRKIGDIVNTKNGRLLIEGINPDGSYRGRSVQ